ncbi:hydroxyacylglutathione hydrolase [Devosia limi DSM 17137]|uniref:Hydroxyacylglutathione hydrolase n=1 Tax=Devosia limi DSM 17137 TaxID=1121477 RepID=A0A0F5LUD4_9HYPH|nr:hydroxyacylglutathione hydrolase [Devosia limi]KKB85262.1 hydroxyacylglutathione hydrolase [Devosia limi DSM 17137]SHF87734.1 hydroxyacylglutathione hydrolase [Devosia limi DSM 17137]
MGLIVDVFEARSDNYGYLAHDTATGRTAAIDAPEAGPIKNALLHRGWRLTDIFITHHHIDHVEAIPELKAEFGVTVSGPRAEADNIPGLDVLLDPGTTLALGETTFEIFATPGHTLGHIVFYNPAGGHLFSADALFSLGVGRMFEGTPGPMWEGLKVLRALPDATLVYPGHEYTASNAKFALSIDPDNAVLQTRAAEVHALRAAGRFTVPANLGIEKQANPFLRADDPVIARYYGLEGADPAEVFAAIRKGKDTF